MLLLIVNQLRFLAAAAMRKRQIGPVVFSLASCLGFALMVAFVMVAIPQSVSHVHTIYGKHNLSDLTKWYYRLALLVIWFGLVELHQVLHASGDDHRELRLRFWGLRIGSRPDKHARSLLALAAPLLVVLLLIWLEKVSYNLGMIGTYMIWPLLIMMIADMTRWVRNLPPVQMAMASAKSMQNTSSSARARTANERQSSTHAAPTSKHRQSHNRSKKKRKRR